MIKELGQSYIVSKGGLYVVALSKNFCLDAVMNKIIDSRTNERLPYDLDTKILIYEDRQKTWFFEIADCLKLMNEAGFILLMICVSYLEANQQFREGRPSKMGESGEFIEKAVKRIFSGFKPEWTDRLIDGARNGLFHSGLTKKGTLISGNPKEVFTELQGNLVINPNLFLDAVKKDCEEYITKLKKKESEEDRQKFLSYWDGTKGLISP